MPRFQRSFRSVGPVILAFFVIFTGTAIADASPILIDLGPTTTYRPPPLDFAFSALNGTPLAGQSLSLDFVFANSEWILASDDHHSVLLMMQTDNTGSLLPLGLPGTGFFLDANGNSINGSMNLCCPGGSTTKDMFAALYSSAAFDQVNPIVGPFSYYGIHYDFTLPSKSGTSITSANLRVVGTDYVGGVPDSSSSIALLAIGMGAVILLQLRLDRRKP